MNRSVCAVFVVAAVLVGSMILRAQQPRSGAEPPVSSNPEASRQYGLGQDALRVRDVERAVQHAEKAVALDGTNARILLMLGDACCASARQASVFTRMSWASRCRDAYLKAVKADPKGLDGRLRLLDYYLQAPAIVGGGADQATAVVQEIAGLSPLQGHRARARVWLSQKKPLDAIAELEKAVAIAATDRATVRWLLTLCVRNNQVPRAQALAAKYEQVDRFEGHLARTVIHEAQENWPGAAGELEAALRIKPDDTEAQFGLAGYYLRMEKQDAAAAVYQQMVARDPSLRDAWLGLGRYSAVTGKELARGLASLDRYLALTAAHEQSRQSPAHWRKGMIFVRMGDTAKARAEYEAAVRLNPKNTEAQKALTALKGR